MATCEPSICEDRDQRRIVLRSAEPADGAALVSFNRELTTDGAGMVLQPDEVKSASEYEEVVTSARASDDDLHLLAFADDRLVGEISFHAEKLARLRHQGELAMALIPDFRGRGLGGAMLGSLIALLRSNPRISKLSLRVLAHNTPAIALYTKLGFSEEGRLHRAIRYRDGSYADDLMMALFL